MLPDFELPRLWEGASIPEGRIVSLISPLSSVIRYFSSCILELAC